jgi:hypothetical protein
MRTGRPYARSFHGRAPRGRRVDLAQLEMTEKAKRARIGSGMFAGAELPCLAAFGAFTACLILALNLATADARL